MKNNSRLQIYDHDLRLRFAITICDYGLAPGQASGDIDESEEPSQVVVVDRGQQDWFGSPGSGRTSPPESAATTDEFIITRVTAADANNRRFLETTEAFEAVWAFLSQVPNAQFPTSKYT